MKRITMGTLLIILVLAALPVSAQETDQNDPYLMTMMKMIPAEAATPLNAPYLMIQFADFRANDAARPGVVTPINCDEFGAMDNNALDLWRANSNRLITLAPDLQNIYGFDAEMVNYYGFDYFEIDRSFYFGPAPDQGVIYGGHFDTERIITTMTERTYATTELNGFITLCGPVGCENGLKIMQWLPDQGEIDPLTFKREGVYGILGGRYGRQEPFALAAGTMLSTPDWEWLAMMTAAAAGERDSLYDLAEYRALADFAVSEYDLIQVLFFAPQLYAVDYLSNYFATTGENVSEEQLAIFREALEIDETGKPLYAEDLPLYPLGAIVDQQDGSDQLHSLVLVYLSEDAAQTAANEMARRIPLHTAFLEWKTYEPIIDLALGDSPYIVEPGRVVHLPEANRWLAVATVRTPLPDNELDENGFPVSSGRLLSYWYRSMLTNNFTPVQLFGAGE